MVHFKRFYAARQYQLLGWWWIDLEIDLQNGILIEWLLDQSFDECNSNLSIDNEVSPRYKTNNSSNF